MALRRQRSFKADFASLEAAVKSQAEEMFNDLGQQMVEHARTVYTHEEGDTGPGFTNRTHKLEESFRGAVDLKPKSVTLRMSATKSYAKYVEGIKDGKYAYLRPTLEDMLPVAEKMMKDRLDIRAVAVRMGQGKAGQARIKELIAKGRAEEAAGR